jgi:hypothetical protein
MTAHIIIVVAALICFAASAAGIPSRINLTALGLFILTLLLLSL